MEASLIGIRKIAVAFNSWRFGPRTSFQRQGMSLFVNDSKAASRLK
jgi:hypothetical protein